MIHISDRVKRAVAFYFSVLLFFVSSPIVLSYSLGYSIDFRAFNIYKTGIVYIRSQPSGAGIYINGRILPDLTPARIENLKPGTYRVEVRREGFYPWQKDLVVRPNMVTKADDIILFRIAQDLKKVGSYEVINFIISDKNHIYYMTNVGLIKANIDGTGVKRISSYSTWPKRITGKRFSSDGNKFLFFNEACIWVAYLSLDETQPKTDQIARIEEVAVSPSAIMDAFWYSESKHIVFVTEKDINVVELYGKGTRNTAVLYKFNAKPEGLYYDKNNDSLYFTDLSGADARPRSFLYRLDLRQKFFSQILQKLREEFEPRYETR